MYSGNDMLYLIRRPDATSDFLRSMSNSKNERYRRAIANHRNTPDDVLIKLSKDKSLQVRKRIVVRQRLPIEALRNLSKDRSETIRKYVAEHGDSDEGVLRHLSKSKLPYIIRCVVNNSNVSMDVVERFIDDPVMSQYIAIKHNLPREFYVRLSSSPHSYVRERIACNLAVPPNILENMALIEDSPWVKKMLINNKNVTFETLRILMNDNDIYVRQNATRTARSRPDRWEEI